MAENTDRKQKPHLYKKGQSGNPKGKQPGHHCGRQCDGCDVFFEAIGGSHAPEIIN